MSEPASAFERSIAVSIDYILGLAVSVLLTGYLLVALLRPERF